MTSTPPVVLVGNRILGIVALTVAGVALLPAAAPLGPGRVVLAVAAAAAGVAIVLRRVELHPDAVRWRTLARTRSCPRSHLTEVGLDHRFLRFRPSGRPTVRIEVPAELRPEVRDWAEAVPPLPAGDA